MSLTLLIDGDIIVYRAGFAADQTMYEVYVDDDHAIPAYTSVYMKEVSQWLESNNISEYEISRTPAHKEPDAALANARDMLYNMYSKFKPTDVKIYIDGEGNFRNDVATYAKYKGNRDKSRRPVHYHEIREYLVKHHGAVLAEGIEADDALGIEQTDSTIICSIDKDLKQIPGKHYNWVKDELTHVTPEESERTFHKQILTGDNSDNIVGIVGVGDKTAEKILGNNPDRYWDNIAAAYNDRFIKKLPQGMTLEEGPSVVYPHWDTGKTVYKTPEEYAEEVANLVFIQREGYREWRPPLKIQ